ncbi:hypothetical protein [Runella sp. SP2]|uniref:hypothetical protein n=1 Tax=Runella sp. SP2 TaxID=2268026 RepID=UPI000F0851EC|nr:hypothetical protein [Runella sp. SP2]AYQ33774.1 hypothetical protein DTQ70_17140 [Runella sp. SP2]
MKKTLTLALCCIALWNTANAQIKIPLDKSGEIKDVKLVNNQSFELLSCDKFIDGSITFEEDADRTLTLGKSDILEICRNGGKFSLGNFKLNVGNRTIEILPPTKKIIIEIKNTPAPAGEVTEKKEAPKPYEPTDFIATEAPKLYEFMKKGDINGVKALLKQFNIETEKDIDNELLKSIKVKDDKENDKKLSDYLNAASVKRNIDDVLSTNKSVAQSGLPSPILVADALGTFIAKRFKEEINIAYLEKFKTFLQEQEEYRSILPQTYDVLKNQEPYNYTVFLQALHEAFDEDMRGLPNNTLTFLEGFDSQKLTNIQGNLKAKIKTIQASDISDKCKKSEEDKLKKKIDLLEKFKVFINAYKNEIYSTLAVLRTVERANAENIVVALSNLDELSSINNLEETAPIRNILKLSGLFARNMRVGEDGFIDKKALEYYKKPEVVQIFLGLLLKKEETALKQIFIDASKNTLYEALNTASAVNILSHLNSLTNDYQKFLKADKPSADDATLRKSQQVTFIATRSQAAIDMLGHLANLSNTLGITNTNQVTEFEKYRSAAKTFVTISKNVIEKDYGIAVNGVFNLIEILELNNDSERSPLFREFLKYGMFAATVASAETSAEMVAALETAALPVGSYRIKRNNRLNISVNSYGGISGGYEEFRAQGGGFFAPSALVGFYIGRGTQQKNVKNNDGCSNGVFLSLIDVGGIFALRLIGSDTTKNKTTTAVLPEISWRNILTPGIYYVHGFKNSPISLGVGFQRAPQLRLSDKNNSLTILDVDAWRIGAKLTIDIPLFNIKTRADKK